MSKVYDLKPSRPGACGRVCKVREGKVAEEKLASGE